MIKGTVFKYGDNVDTDVIIPARYLNNPDKSELAKHCMEDIDPNFAKNVKKGDIIVAGFNFGCGSSREHAPIAISACNVSLVIAKSFARIFYRNSINIGFPILECEECVDNVKSGDELSVDLEKGIIIVNNSIEFKANSFPPFIQKIVEDGGLLNYIKNRKVKR